MGAPSRVLARLRRSRWTTALFVVVAVATVCIAGTAATRHTQGSTASAAPESHAPPATSAYPPAPPEPKPGKSPDQPPVPRKCLSSPTGIISVAVEKCDLLPHIAGAPTIVLWGDSHAWQQIPALEAAIGHQRVNLVSFLMGGCPPMDVHIGATANTCDRIGQLALSYLRHAHRHHRQVRLVVAMGWELYHDVVSHPDQTGEVYPQFRTPWIVRNARKAYAGVPRAFHDLGRMHMPTDVVGQLPMVYVDPPACAKGRMPYRCALPRDAALRSAGANYAYIRRLRSYLTEPGRLIRPAQAICRPTRCPGTVDGLPTYYDDFHIGSRLSARLGPRFFGPTVRALLREHP